MSADTKTVTFRFPEAIHRRLQQERGEQSSTAYILESLESRWNPPVAAMQEVTAETPPPPTVVTREEAAEALLPFIDPVQREFIWQMCREHGRQPADYLLSYIELIRERGESSYYMGDARVKRTATTSTGETGLADSTCEQCHQVFPPQRFGQRFCSNACGMDYNRLMKQQALAEQGTYNPLSQDNSDIHAPAPPSIDAVALRNALIGHQEAPASDEELTLS